MEFPIFENMMTAVDGALAALIAKYAGFIALISGPLRVGVTIYIILLGFAILRGAVQYPFREFVYRGVKLAALVYAVTTLYGASVGLFTVNGLPTQFANAVGGADINGLGGYFDGLIRGAARAIARINEIVERHTTEQGYNLMGIPRNFLEIILAGLANLLILCIALLSAALGFTICAFALFALALLAVVGPLFVAALLFESTRSYFFAWLGSAINYLMLVAFALLVTLFISQTTDTFINAITTDDEVLTAVFKAISFYILGFFFFLQIPSLAAGLGGGGASIATQFANAVTGGIAPRVGNAMSNAPSAAAARAWRSMRGGGGGSGGGELRRTT